MIATVKMIYLHIFTLLCILFAMRHGFILLHRKGITAAEWRHPKRTLAWIDFCTMAAYEDYMAEDGVWIRKGEVIASYGFLGRRWRIAKGTVHRWMSHWIAQRQVERRPERCVERDAERFFLINYSKYQEPIVEAQRPVERRRQPQRQPMKRREGEDDRRKENTETSLVQIFSSFRSKIFEFEFADEAYADKLVEQTSKLSKDDRSECARKIEVFLNCCKSPQHHGKARVLFAEIAGLVNDRGAMQKRLSDAERAERDAYRESE